MATIFAGEIKMVGCNFEIQGYAYCNGALLSIAGNSILYTIIGTTYGGDGVTTFGLPDLRGRFPIHQGTGFTIGQMAGTETVTLLATQLPVHSHQANASGTGNSETPANNYWAKSNSGKPYAVPGGAPVAMNPATVGLKGNSAPHENMHPFLGINYLIALDGPFPVQ
jgi:microcystin-dependent protein